MKNSFYIDLQRFMLIPTKFPLTPQMGILLFMADFNKNSHPAELNSVGRLFLFVEEGLLHDDEVVVFLAFLSENVLAVE